MTFKIKTTEGIVVVFGEEQRDVSFSSFEEAKEKLEQVLPLNTDRQIHNFIIYEDK